MYNLDYKAPSRNAISKELKRLHTKHFFSLINSLSKIPFISISTDFWTNIKGVSFLVLTGHYITDEFDLNSTILRFSSFHQRHFSDLIGIEIEKQLVELKLFDKVTSITCDGAPNMVKMFDYLSRPDITRIRCQAHLLHLIVCNGLGLWIDKRKKTTTTDRTNLIDSEGGLSQSLKKVNIIDDEELSVQEDDFDNNSEGSGLQDENDESVSIIFFM
jgi:hypothetical protein